MPTHPTDERSTVLLVDDDVAVLETTAALLADDFHVTAEHTSNRALARLGEERVDLLCTDYQLPGLDGLELIQRANALQPGLVSVLVTAYSELLRRDGRRRTGHSLLLIKPYAPPKLLETLKQAEHFARVNRLMAGAQRVSARR